MSRLEFVLQRIAASDLSAKAKREATNNALRSYTDETDILYSVFQIKATWRFVGEIFKGAHVRIFDFGARYNEWKQLKRAGTRRSSHRSQGPQYHVDGPLVHTVLFGFIDNQTWLQLENHPNGGLGNFVGHFFDFVKYGVFKENQGPYGASRYVENRPILIQPPAPPPRVIQHQAVFR